MRSSSSPRDDSGRGGRRPAVAAVVVAVVVLLGAACSSRSPSAHAAGTYVALGDSIASGEGVAPYDAGTDVLFGSARNTCHRSAAAYPRVLYASGLALRHVACSGAELRDLTSPQQAGQPAQLDSVTRQTELVTLTIGANDTGAVRAMLRCVVAGLTCESESDRVNAAVVTFAAALPAVIGQIQRRAPKAQVVVTGYPQILPPAAADCAALGPLTPRDREAAVAWFRAETTSLNGVLRAVAATTRSTFVDTEAAFSGHELCTAEPWVLPLTPTDLTGSFHPTAAGQAALANVVAAEVRAQ